MWMTGLRYLVGSLSTSYIASCWRATVVDSLQESCYKRVLSHSVPSVWNHELTEARTGLQGVYNRNAWLTNSPPPTALCGMWFPRTVNKTGTLFNFCHGKTILHNTIRSSFQWHKVGQHQPPSGTKICDKVFLYIKPVILLFHKLVMLIALANVGFGLPHFLTNWDKVCNPWAHEDQWRHATLRSWIRSVRRKRTQRNTNRSPHHEMGPSTFS